MLFHSPGFLFLFLPAFLLAVFSTKKGMSRSIVLLIFSYFFYSGSEPLFLLLLVFSSLTDYSVSLRLHAEEKPVFRRLWVLVSLLVNLTLLGFYKYGGWVIPGLSPYLEWLNIPLPQPEFFKTYTLPPGISFYTFQSLAYTIDVYRRQIKPERNLISFCNYVAYLPQLIAGPIERYSHLSPQLKNFVAARNTYQWSEGIDRITLGIAQKLLLADSLGAIVDRLAFVTDAHDFISSWSLSLAFGMQIYYDFAAYTHMAIGISLILGVRLKENFLSPYKAATIQDFWRRWHITLSNWFRDYVYIPLGGSKKGNTQTFLNILLTFILCGLWHGAGWNYILWGTLHGIMVALYHLKTKIIPKKLIPYGISVIITFTLIHFIWIPFRISDIYQVITIWKGMLCLNGFANSLVTLSDFIFILCVTAGTLILPNASQRWPGRSGWLESAAILFIAVFAVFVSPSINNFIYFQF